MSAQTAALCATMKCPFVDAASSKMVQDSACFLGAVCTDKITGGRCQATATAAKEAEALPINEHPCWMQQYLHAWGEERMGGTCAWIVEGDGADLILR
eukprot:1144902-Pelagomonas_calceolata.AAC.6